MQANIGNLQRDLVFGFTEPYLRDRPLQFGFQVYTRKSTYDQARQEAIFSGQSYEPALGLCCRTCKTTRSRAKDSAPLWLIRCIGHSSGWVLSYSYDVSSLVALTNASKSLFNYLAFSGISGPSALDGIVTSKLVPSYSKNTLDAAISPHSGSSYYMGGEFSGIGGTVKTIRPVLQYKRFIPVQNRRNTVGFNVQASFLTGFDGRVAPPFQRSYMGGENDLRGFDIRSVSPVAFLPTTASVVLRNPDGSPVLKDPTNPSRGSYTIPVPVEQIVFPGGDASFVTNLEYRITIAGPVALAPFMDVGIDPILRNSQLRINSSEQNLINSTVFGCPCARPDYFQLRRWPKAGKLERLSAFLAKPFDFREHQLGAQNVYRTGVASVPAGGQCAFPHLLGLQPAAPGYDRELSDSSDYQLVPVQALSHGIGVHVPVEQERVLAAISAARAAQDLPLLGRDDVLVTRQGRRIFLANFAGRSF